MYHASILNNGSLCNFLIKGGVVLSPDPIKPNLGGSGLGQSSRRGKARISFLVNRGPVQNQHIINRQITTPGTIQIHFLFMFIKFTII